MADTLAAALAAFHVELPRVAKDNTAKVKSDKGSYTYRYADLAEISPIILPLLGRNGLAWMTCPTLTPDGRFVLRYALKHISGEAETGEYPLPKPESSPQVLGSAITYARRYALCAVTGVAPGGDDDDAAEAQRRQEPAVAEQFDPADAADPDEAATEWRRRLSALIQDKGRTPAWGAAQYYQWSKGGDIRAAKPDELRDFHRHLREEPDVWDTGESS